jgi:DNA-binding transcriptional MerR regulator
MDDNVADEGKLAIDALDLLTIGEMSERFGITLRALRFYEARGLLSPQRAGSVRLYGPTDTRRLALILKGKHLGFTLTEIRAMVATDSGEAAARGELAIAPDLVVAQLESLRRQRGNIEQAIVELEATHQRMAMMDGGALNRAASAQSAASHAA